MGQAGQSPEHRGQQGFRLHVSRPLQSDPPKPFPLSPYMQSRRGIVQGQGSDQPGALGGKWASWPIPEHRGQQGFRLLVSRPLQSGPPDPFPLSPYMQSRRGIMQGQVSDQPGALGGIWASWPISFIQGPAGVSPACEPPAAVRPAQTLPPISVYAVAA